MNVKNSIFLSCTANHYENLENPSLNLETEFASRSMTYPLGWVLSHSLHKKFLNLLQFFPENLQYTQKRTNKTSLSMVNFIKTSWWKSFNNGIIYDSIAFQCVCTFFSGQYNQFLYKFFTGTTESEKSMRGCNFRNILPINIPKW